MSVQVSDHIPAIDVANVAHRRLIMYVITAVLLTVLYVAMRGSDWHGSVELHTIMEALASLLAISVGVLTLHRYHTHHSDIVALVVGAGFIGTGLLDGYHMVVTSIWVKDELPSVLSSLIPWSWVASRLFLATMMLLAWAAWSRTLKLGEYHGINPALVYISTIVLTVLCGLYFAFIPLPKAYYPDLFAHRPEEFLPGVLFLIAIYKFLKKGDWQHNVFEHWLVMSLVVNAVAQIVYMPYSSEIFDMQFDAAHAMKKLAYVCVLTGLLCAYGVSKLKTNPFR